VPSRSKPAISAAVSPIAIGNGFVAGVNVLEFRVPAGEWFLGLLVADLSGTAQVASQPQAVATIPGLFDTGVDTLGAALAGGELDPHYRSDEPPLRAKGRSIAPNPDFGFTVDSEPNRLVLLAFAHSAANVPIGNGCTQWIDTTGMVAVLGWTDSAGVARFATPIPPLGVFGFPIAFDVQAVVHDPASPLAGLSLTQGVALITGL
jgi:hypothetical protein